MTYRMAGAYNPQIAKALMEQGFDGNIAIRLIAWKNQLPADKQSGLSPLCGRDHDGVEKVRWIPFAKQRDGSIAVEI